MPFADPEQRRAYQREYARRRRHGGEGPPPGQVALPAPFRLNTARQVLALIEEQVNAVRADPALSSVERARCIGALANTALRAVQVGDLEARLESLEAVLSARKRPK